MNLFIDTNIYLNFYHFTNEDLEELRKLLVLIERKEIKLFLTEQVIDEFTRNREGRIADALKNLAQQKLPNQFPQLLKGYPEYEKMREAIRFFQENKLKINEKLDKDINEKSLIADKIIADLFKNSEIIKKNDNIIEKAKLRMDIGNPPGKNGSYGDAINWETLLDAIPPSEDLYIISGDGDYSSEINENQLKQFLKEEWIKEHGSIFFYPKLSDFFSDKFSRIKLASELEKELLITDLIISPSFTATHMILRKLSPLIPDFLENQVNIIADALIENSQIFWISQDEDVQLFVRDLIKNKGELIQKEKLEDLLRIYNKEAEPENKEE